MFRHPSIEIFSRLRQLRSISVGSSAGAFELLTRFDTGQRCRTFSAAGLSRSWPALPSIRVDARTAAVRRA